jgi:hypothetical protein
VIDTVDRHADVMQERPARDHDLGVAIPHAMVGDHRGLDAALDEESEQPQGDVEDDLDVHPGVIRHAEPLRGDLRHVPPGPHPHVGVDRLEEALEAAVPARRGVHLRARRRLGDRTGAHIWALCFHFGDLFRGRLGGLHDWMSDTQFPAICGLSDRGRGYREVPSA